MSQSTLIKVPTPVHAQLKLLAQRRGMTMVGVIEETIRRAISDGEIEDETPGLKVTILLDLDAKDHGPFVRVTTPKGELPNMTREDAEAVASFLEEIAPGSDNVHVRTNRGCRWDVSFVGVAIKLTGRGPLDKSPTEAVMTASIAKGFARQLRKAAESAVRDVE